MPSLRGARRLFALAGLALGLACLSPMASAQYTTLKFQDSFDRKGKLSSAWQVAAWRNGHPFGCTFAPQEVSQSQGTLKLAFDGSNGNCAEVRTLQSWQYGAFAVEMQPAGVPGTVSSFFLYTGVAGTSSHFEIDIEFVGNTGRMHTNVWVAGQPNQYDVDLTALGINPYNSMRTYGIVWAPDAISFQLKNDAGQWVEVKRVAVAISTPMQLMMNAWYGDNMDTALTFPGYYSNTPGQARYNSVSVWQ